MKLSKIHIGTSGWSYKHWRGTFYPSDVKEKARFEYYSQHFDTVEINSSFYHMPPEKTFENWGKAAPEHFLYAVKAGRYITHLKKLADVQESVDYFLKNSAALQEKLGPILFQLPPSWPVNVERFRTFVKYLPRGGRYTFEFRNPTWYNEKIVDILSEYNAAFCLYELNRHSSPEWVTADFVYVRLHGPNGKYEGSYSTETLQSWTERALAWQKEGKDVFVYFDNDQLGYAAFNAEEMKKQVDQFQSSLRKNE